MSGTAAEPRHSRVRGWFESTGAPPAWGMVRYMVCGLVAGAALTGLLPDFRATLLAALTGAVAAASGSAGPSGVSRRIALIGAGLSLVLTVDTIAGCAIALVATYLLWPRDREARESVPVTAT